MLMLSQKAENCIPVFSESQLAPIRLEKLNLPLVVNLQLFGIHYRGWLLLVSNRDATNESLLSC